MRVNLRRKLRLKGAMVRVEYGWKILKYVTAVVSVSLLIKNGTGTVTAFAEEVTTEVTGKVYSLDDSSKYQYLEKEDYEEANSENTYGIFSITGNIVEEVEKDGITAYEINGDTVSLSYIYTDKYSEVEDEDWHLIKDKTKTVADIKLSSNVAKGAIILQTSKDGEKWVTDAELTNAFAEAPNGEENFYSANDVQLTNGTYFRLLVAYRTGRKVGENKVWKVDTGDKYEYEKYAAVYELYLYNTASIEAASDTTVSKTLGSTIKTSNSGYTGEKSIGLKDPHYGWEIGQFWVSGYTRETKVDDTPVFLKNVGDQITLWFNLEQDITCLNGDKNLSISDDNNGYDENFQLAKTDMGHGTLIIQYTDEQGVKHDPEIYTNFLEASATTSADTVVKLLEEGDYKIALDYEIKSVPRKVANIEVVPEYTNYRIAFTFSVRNGNCMVYPFDIVTGAELSDTAITENGFKLDMARSRYLTIDVQYSTVTESSNGYKEDVRFNRPAKDGDSYDDEGIYTFNVKNLYTGENTTKTIYVGTSAFIKALAVNSITVSELNEKLADGSMLGDDGDFLTDANGDIVSFMPIDIE